MAAHLRRLIAMGGRFANVAGRPFLRRLATLLIAGWAPFPAHAQSFAELQALDARLSTAADRLLVANAPLCRNLMPLTGMILHSRDQYGGDWADPLFVQALLAIAQVLPDSPAADAGLQGGDGIIALEGALPPAVEGQTLREAALARVQVSWQAGTSLALTIRRDGTDRAMVLQPTPGCAVLVEVGTDSALAARTDGQIIRIGHRLVAAASDSDLAIILAHELGHVILRHRERLAAIAGEEEKAPRRYRRRAEEEADRLSPYLLANAGLPPASVPAFWRSPLGRRVNHGLLRDRAYPPTSERASLAEAEVAILTAAPVPAPPDLLAARDEALLPAD